jgi:pimeloyl-ACP methyl ester carboxylesterase
MAQVLFAFVLILFAQNIFAQNPFLQDTTLNNLIHPAGYQICEPGQLGTVRKQGSGKRNMIIITGLGFGGDVFDNFMEANKKKYTMYVVTPAGFANTPAPPMPASGVPYAQLTWTNNIVTGIVNLIMKEKIVKPIVVAHFVTATQVAFNLALNHPGMISKVIIMGGSPYRYYPGQKEGTYSDWEHEQQYTPEQRARLVEVYWAPRWFKTVTKKTWDQNMWAPDDYCKDTFTGRQLCKLSSEVALAVMVRYLIEWMTYDITDNYKSITVPVLILIPDFKGVLPGSVELNESISNPSKQYLRYLHQESWRQARECGNTMLTFKRIPDTRLFMWYDNAAAVYKAIDDFTDSGD